MRKQPKQSPFSVASITRYRIINIGKTVLYNAVKDRLIFVGLMMDGVASPVDIVKSRWVPPGRLRGKLFSMNAESGQYRGALHCAANTHHHNL